MREVETASSKETLISTNVGTCLCFLFAVAAVFTNTLMGTNPDHLSVFFLDSILIFFLLLSGISSLLSNSDKFFTSRDNAKIALLVFVVICTVFIRGVISTITHNTEFSNCAAAGGFLIRSECLIYASALGNASIRIALPHFFAFFVGILSAIICQNHRSKLSYFIFVAASTVIIFIIEEFLARSEVTRPFHNQIFGALGRGRYGVMSGSFTNFGWTWPYVAPICAIALWLAAGDHKRSVRATGLILTFLSAWIMLTNGQRGSVITCLSLVFVSCGWVFWHDVLKKKSSPSKFRTIFSLLIVLLIAVCGIALLRTENLNAINAVTSNFGLVIKKLPLSVSYDRLALWRFGFEIWKDNPFFGTGHGSWFWISREHVGLIRPNLIFESAHNLYVQIFTELGLLHGLLILSVFIHLAFNVLLRLKGEASGLLLFFLLIAAFANATIFQEIDYIKTTYYLWAVIIGLCLVDLKPSSMIRITNVKKKGLLTLSVLLFAIFCLNSLFPSGTFAFEPNKNVTFWPTWERWVKKDFKLVATPGNFKDQGYTLYPLVVSFISINPKDQPNDYSEHDQKLVSDLQLNDRIFVSIPGPRVGLSNKTASFSFQQKIDSRFASARIQYPPFQSKVSLIWSRNFSIESNVGDLALNCNAQNCQLLIGACRNPTDSITFEISEQSSILTANLVEGHLNASFQSAFATASLAPSDLLNFDGSKNWVIKGASDKKMTLLNLTPAAEGGVAISNLNCQP